MRGDKEQKIVAFNIGASDWDDFAAWSEGQDVPADLGLDVLLNYDFKNDPNKMVGNGRYLCKGRRCSSPGSRVSASRPS